MRACERGAMSLTPRHHAQESAMRAAPRKPVQQAATRNRLLAALPPEDLERLLEHQVSDRQNGAIDTVLLNAGAVLYEPGDAIQSIYFPTDCLISLLAVVEGRMTLEVGLVGCEGMVGASVALGHDVGQVRAVVQRAGSAVCIDSALFRAEFTQNLSLQRVLYRYTDGLLAQAIQIAVCSRFHVLEARLARSLLVTRDRLQSDKFHLTHEFLAHALGVRRVGVTKAASALQQQKLINYSRGNIEIIDAPGLAAVSCRCYEIVKGTGLDALADSFV
jgi:CRP-like cAMP-binding protein